MGAGRGVRRNLTLDAGALIAYQRRDRSVHAAIRVALDAGLKVMIPAGALAQVWRDGRRQALLSSLLKDPRVKVADLTEPTAKASGELCGRTDTSDVVDASVVVCARGQHAAAVMTSDPADIRHLDPRLEVRAI